MERDGLDSLLSKIASSDHVAVDPSMFRMFREHIDVSTPNAAGHWYLAKHIKGKGAQRLLDFGCGSSPHRQYIEKLGYSYSGVDLARTTGYRGNLENSNDVAFYDGRDLPFPAGMFDVVYSNQVFEHVLDPFQSMGECSRVLKQGGAFIGAVSFLEPYHAYQTFSYTPYGFTKVAERSGLTLHQIFPNRDVLQILLRKLLIVTRNEFTDNFDDYPRITTLLERAYSKLSAPEQLSFSLQFCGSFSYCFEKTGAVQTT